MEIKIMSNGDAEAVLRRMAESNKELTGKGYVNPQSGIKGIMIHLEDDSTTMLDIFIEGTPDDERFDPKMRKLQ